MDRNQNKSPKPENPTLIKFKKDETAKFQPPPNSLFPTWAQPEVCFWHVLQGVWLR